MMTDTTAIENLTLQVTQEIRVRASLETTFKALVDQLGWANEAPDGTPMPMTLEAWPGGRWFRDLGQGNGHYWGTVQAIKRPTLLEIAEQNQGIPLQTVIDSTFDQVLQVLATRPKTDRWE